MSESNCDLKYSFNKYYLDVIRNNYINFDGRATRKEFGIFMLWNLAVVFVLMVVGGSFIDIGAMSTICVIVTALPTVSLFVRRVHDIGLSGFLLFLPGGSLYPMARAASRNPEAVPFLLGIYYLCCCLLLLIIPGQNRYNEYGENPYSKEKMSDENLHDEDSVEDMTNKGV